MRNAYTKLEKSAIYILEGIKDLKPMYPKIHLQRTKANRPATMLRVIGP
jgi:hypothetical protein